MSLDRVEFSGPRGAAEEMELELRAGDTTALRELSARVALEYSLQPSNGSKFERATALVG